MKFWEVKLEDRVVDGLEGMNLEDCTGVEEDRMGVMVEGKEVIGVGERGRGKRGG